jgi:3-hydroxy acid dehydrogenase/malonic semialdehyde reductase
LGVQAGSNVALLARRLDNLKAVVVACTAAHKESGIEQGGKFAAIQLDVSDKSQVAALWNKLPEYLSDVDILGKYRTVPNQRNKWILIKCLPVNNAGYVQGLDHVGDIDESVVSGMFATNVIGLIGMTQQLVKREHSFSRSIDPPSPFYSYTVLDFKAKQSGHVINIGSIAGREPYVGGSIYNATKFAVKAFTGSLMRELVNTPIRVSEIQPGRSLLSSLHLLSLI